MNSTGPDINTKPENISVKSFLFKSIKYWYLFVIALVLSYSIAYYKVRYNIPTYNVNARILIKDEFSSWGQEYFLHGMELVSARNRLVNEIGIIRSFPIMRKVMDGLPDFRVTYNDIGNIKTTELYKEAPFVVEWDTIGKSVYNRTFYFKIISGDKFLISERRFEDEVGLEYSFNDPFKIDDNIIEIKLKQVYTPEFNKKLYSFRINNMDDLAVSYLGNIGLNVEVKESSILVLSSSGTNTQKTIDFINGLINVYIQHGVEQASMTVTNTLTFVDRQLRSISDSLGVSEDDMQSFSTDLNNKKLTIKEDDLLVGSIVELERQKINIQFNLNYYKYILDYITKNDDSKGLIIPSIVDGDGHYGIMSTNINKLMNLYAQRSGYNFSMTDKSASYQQLLIEIALVKQILAENIRSVIEKLKFDMEQLDDQLLKAEGKLSIIPPAQRQYTTIQRKYTLSNSLYTYLLQKRSEASIAKAANISKVQVLDWASRYRVSYTGVPPGTIYTTYISSGIAIAAGVVLLILFFNTSIIDKNDIETVTKIPIIGIIGHSNKGSSNVVIDSPKSVISEAFRGVRTNLGYMTAGKDKIVVVITSSVSGEGKTFCAINLASIYALSGKKTLLLGADLRRPKIYMDFGLNNNIGMSNYLINKATFEEVIQLTNLENLDIILSGPVPPNPAELLGSSATEELINKAKEKYDVVIIDTAPFGLVTDSLLITSFADANLYVVRQFYTKRKQLHAINQHFVEGKTKNLGIVVNDLKQERWGYGSYGYGYGYGYGGTYGYGYGYYSDDMAKNKKGFSWKSIFGIKSQG
ncbi:MAG: polysaccharide biosynthesis tyrosine autokinase [Bacteroidetes bacterium]|nr:polysaccharide biosynthesis tyrosine autokinase [Bacteroidota bacterium]